MPIYLFKCYVCGKAAEDYHSIMVEDSEIRCDCGEMMGRDFQAEQVGIIPDWKPGYCPGIDYDYSSKADLMSEIKRRGLYPSVHGGGVSVGGSKSGLYGDEEFKNMYKYSEPEEHEGLANEPPII